MFIFKRVPHIHDWVAIRKRKGSKVGFVPTMGALHEGHLSLVKKSKSENHVTMVSIFVNPKQFNDPEDLEKYPRPLERDIKMLYEIGADVVFIPEVDDIYPPGDQHSFDFDPGPAAMRMEGKFRPGHFQGMSEVVHRLLTITTPDHVFMGQKDFQQFSIIRKLIHDFQLPVELKMVPTVREPHGLAMSSRNERLSLQARQQAEVIFRCLAEGKEAFVKGESVQHIRKNAYAALSKENFEPEYFEIVDGRTLESVNTIHDAKQIVACVAVKVEGVRLIDNMIWKDE